MQNNEIFKKNLTGMFSFAFTNNWSCTTCIECNKWPTDLNNDPDNSRKSFNSITFGHESKTSTITTKPFCKIKKANRVRFLQSRSPCLTMLFIVKLWFYKKNKKSWLLHFYFNKTMVNFRKGSVFVYSFSFYICTALTLMFCTV